MGFLTNLSICFVVTCWERADLLALVGDVYFISVTFPCGILGQVWYLLASFPDLCRLSYFEKGVVMILHACFIRETPDAHLRDQLYF